MKIENLIKANNIKGRIDDLEKAVKWIEAGGEINIMANKQIGNSIELSDKQKDILIIEFSKEIQELKDEFEKL